MKRSGCAASAALVLASIGPVPLWAAPTAAPSRSAQAEAAPTAALERPSAADLLERGRQLLEARAAATAAALGGRIDVHVADQAAERLAQVPCSPQVFLPAGGRPTGKTSIGLRCTHQPWQVRIPAEVALLVPVPVPSRPLPAGTVLRESDWSLSEVNVAAWPRGVTTDPRQLEGATTTRPLKAGEPIPPQAVQSRSHLGPGDPVQVVLSGAGFTIKATGKMLHQASPGQPARVQLDSGRTVAGILREDREIEVNL
ncbi:flagella basal body P-ring formation protein FlgA [Pigmentiphaga sp. NML080357]|uniref:flagellar basal body P-ring formation chaperone FlgA n=1 Tax=Pigmentiphaga sp. NML080357 TaxID=2008675 RepID=UPI000B409E36|nr:flagellar basal body P-ring formation chaperone FlgA [Pigmentiphaga sp. NML080357]OVZ58037.1 flagella basal body P-ring formation protein FlgA [Pigmentiphaga sp. NML080357]